MSGSNNAEEGRRILRHNLLPLNRMGEMAVGGLRSFSIIHSRISRDLTIRDRIFRGRNYVPQRTR